MTRELEYYDRPELWGPGSSYEDPSQRTRAEALLRLLPPGTGRVLDVGCGDGAVTNVLAAHHDVTGVDIAVAALAHVKAPTRVASAHDLPFGDRSFDAVVLAEVLEHLPQSTYERALREAARVAARTVVVSVPNRENLRASMVRCPRCGERFSPWRHERAFDAATLRTLLPGFELETVMEHGPPTERLTTVEVLVRRQLARGAPLPFPAVCPGCGERGVRRQGGRQGPTFGRLRRSGLQRMIRPRPRPQWLLARYVRADKASSSRSS